MRNLIPEGGFGTDDWVAIMKAGNNFWVLLPARYSPDNIRDFGLDLTLPKELDPWPSTDNVDSFLRNLNSAQKSHIAKKSNPARSRSLQ